MESLRLPAALESLEAFRQFVAGQAAAGHLAAPLVSKIELVLEEILTNHAKHAYQDHPGETEVRCFLRPDGCFCLQLADWGPAFDPLRQPAPDTAAPLEERRIGGLGLHLVRNLADHLEYCRDGERNVLTVCFRTLRDGQD